MKKRGISEKSEPRIIPRPEHQVSRDHISPNALKVLYRLHKAGYQAFLVGGCVRDALVGLRPKDFDVATDAHPDEVRALFGNCRLIGRRFRLAHVRFGREVIEVATFRASAEDGKAHTDVEVDTKGRIVRDNVYGGIDDDVWRRDFTCNALYYNIADFSIWDYVGGMEDVLDRRIELIGDPATRLREDPVRMLRAVRFAAKLGFTIDEATEKAVHAHRELLANVPAARLFDEFLKLFQSGYAEKTFEILNQFDLFAMLFPDTAKRVAEDNNYKAFVISALRNTDARIKAEKSVTPMFLLGVFLWAATKSRAANLRDKEKLSMAQAMSIAASESATQQQLRVSIPRRFTAPMREMLAMQPRFDVMRGKRGLKLLEHRRFRAAYDFMLLRAQCGEVQEATAEFWTQIQKQNALQRRKSFQLDVKNKQPGKRRSRRRRRRPASGGSSNA